MTAAILLQIVLFGIALSMDAFAVSVTDGLVYTDLTKRRAIWIAAIFGVMQALMPLVGFWLVYGVTYWVGVAAGDQAGRIAATVVTWIAFALLLFIGGKMMVEAILDMRKPAEEKTPKRFSAREVLLMGMATSIDALAVGVSLHAGLSTTATVWLHVAIIMLCTFALSLVGLFLGRAIDRLFRGKYEITCLIGGAILIALAVWIVVSHHLGM